MFKATISKAVVDAAVAKADADGFTAICEQMNRDGWKPSAAPVQRRTVANPRFRLMIERARLMALKTSSDAEYKAKWEAINQINVRLVAS